MKYHSTPGAQDTLCYFVSVQYTHNYVVHCRFAFTLSAGKVQRMAQGKGQGGQAVEEEAAGEDGRGGSPRPPEEGGRASGLPPLG